jgi:hypothetical protein
MSLKNSRPHNLHEPCSQKSGGRLNFLDKRITSMTAPPPGAYGLLNGHAPMFGVWPTSCPLSGRNQVRVCSVTFKKAIEIFVRNLEVHGPAEYSISRLLIDYEFQRRRFYDVMSVLSAVGCCSRVSSSSLRWLGRAHVPAALVRLQRNAGADSPDATLNEIIGVGPFASISELTVALVLCLLVLRMSSLCIKRASRFLTRGKRWKSTLCKVYQIAHILEAAEIMERSGDGGNVGLAPPFFNPIEINLVEQGVNPFGVTSMLNCDGPEEEVILHIRRRQFDSEVERAMRGRSG